jgi:hypothetical protein
MQVAVKLSPGVTLPSVGGGLLACPPSLPDSRTLLSGDYILITFFGKTRALGVFFEKIFRGAIKRNLSVCESFKFPRFISPECGFYKIIPRL